MDRKKFDDSEFDDLIKQIREGDCVLFLGPDLFRDRDGKNIYEEFSRMKCGQMSQNKINYDESQSSNIYYTVNRYIRGMNDLQEQERRLESVSSLNEKRSFNSLIESSVRENDLYRQLATQYKSG
jgi:hypothetical protein